MGCSSPTRKRESCLALPPSPTAAARSNCSPGNRDGCTEAIMLAHGFTIPQMVVLVGDGLATATAERVVAGGRKVEVARVQSLRRLCKELG